MTVNNFIIGTMQEQNCLIAEFMGRDWKKELKWIEDEDSKKPRQIEVPIDSEDLLYDKSFDELMPVVLKIKYHPESTQMESKRKLFVQDINYALTCCNIGLLFEKVVKYIEWWNEKIRANAG